MTESRTTLRLSFAPASNAAEAGRLQEALSPVVALQGASSSLSADFDLHFLDHIVVFGFEVSACALRRDEAVRREHDFDHFLIVSVSEGEIIGSIGGRQVNLGPGDMAVFDLARDFLLRIPDACRGVAVVMPRQHLAMPRGDPSFHGAAFPGSSVATRLAAAQFATMLEMAQTGMVDDTEAAVAAMTASFEVVVAPLRRRQASIVFDRRDTSMLGKMCRHIDQNIADPKLDVESLSESFAVSRATVYRLFTRHGGVASYIRNIRLDQAFDQIRHAPHNVERLNMLARRFGFTSGDSFARAFQARFGIRPVQLHGGGDEAIRLANRHRRKGQRAEIGIFEGWLLDIGADVQGRSA